MSNYTLRLKFIDEASGEVIERLKIDTPAYVPREGELFEFEDHTEGDDPETTEYRVVSVQNLMKKFPSSKPTGRSFCHEIDVNLRPLTTEER